MGVLAKLTAATPQRRTHTLCLNAQLQAEYDRLADSLDTAREKDLREASLESTLPNLTALVEQMETIRDQMQDSLVTFTIEQVEWTERIALQALHPPRDDQAIDLMRGYNITTFLPALVRASTVQVEDTDGDVIAGVDIPDETWESFTRALNYGGMNRLAGFALAVNDEDAAVPTSARSLLGSQASGASLAQPEPGTSPRSGSEAGSRPRSRRSSTTPKATPKPAESPAT